jgi:hypothetical protein
VWGGPCDTLREGGGREGEEGEWARSKGVCVCGLVKTCALVCARAHKCVCAQCARAYVHACVQSVKERMGERET